MVAACYILLCKGKKKGADGLKKSQEDLTSSQEKLNAAGRKEGGDEEGALAACLVFIVCGVRLVFTVTTAIFVFRC